VLEIPRYLAGSGNDVFGAWMSGLQYDRTNGKIVARIDRLSLGNIGDCKALYKGLFELRIDWGARLPSLLRAGGQSLRVAALWRDKRKQPSDIIRALEYLKDYKKRTS
jgi:putative addiction module killer protein